MQSILALSLILAPMFIGFALPHRKAWHTLAEKSLGYLVYIILIIIGVELGGVQNLHHELPNIALYLATLMTLTLGVGLMPLVIFDKLTAKHINAQTVHRQPIPFKGSLIQLACLAVGFVIAKYIHLTPPEHTITALLMVLLFLVGICLKNSGVSLKQALLNKQGLHISMIFTLFTLAGGVIFAMLFDDVTLTQGLALASGFGWYSLSGTIMTDAYGAVWGSVALLNDLGREILALIFIPAVMCFSPSASIGLSGVTGLDFTLPTLTQAGGMTLMPVIISFGFITNVISPILMVFFASLG